MTKQPIVKREFRGHTLYLESFTRTSNAFCWTNDAAKAMRFETDRQALAVAERARAEFSALAVVDTSDTIIAPASTAKQLKARPLGFERTPANYAESLRRKNKRQEVEQRAVTANVREASIGCVEHGTFTDGCTACYDAHAAISLQ